MNLFTLFSLAVGFIIGVLSQGFYEWWLRPKLEIKDVSLMESDWVVDYSVIVQNKGQTLAKHCVGSVSLNAAPKDLIESTELTPLVKSKPSAELDRFLFYIKKAAEGEGSVKFHLTRSNFREIENEKLCWADIGNPGACNINPGMKTGLEVFRVEKNNNQLYFPSEGGWSHIRMILKPGEYEGKIRISSATAYTNIEERGIKITVTKENRVKLKLL